MYANVSTLKTIETTSAGTVLSCQVNSFYKSLDYSFSSKCVLICTRNAYMNVTIELAGLIPEVEGVIVPTLTDLNEMGHKCVRLDCENPEYILDEALNKYAGVVETAVMIGSTDDYDVIHSIVWALTCKKMDHILLSLASTQTTKLPMFFNMKEHLVPVISPAIGHDVRLDHEKLALTSSVLPEFQSDLKPYRRYVDVPVLTTNRFGPLWRGFTYTEYSNLMKTYVNQAVENIQPSPFWGTVLILATNELMYTGYYLSKKLLSDCSIEHIIVQRLPTSTKETYSYNLGKFDAVIVLGEHGLYKEGTYVNLLAALQNAGNQDIYVFV